MWSSLRRFTAAAVSFSLILTCAGLEPYAAFGASFTKAPETTRVPGVVLPQLPVVPLPTLAAPSALPQSVPALAAPAVAAPSAAAVPSVAAPVAAVAPAAARGRQDVPAAQAAAAQRETAETAKVRADARFDGAAAAKSDEAQPVSAPAASQSSRPALARPTAFKRAKRTLAVAALATVLAATGFVGSFVSKSLPVSPVTFAAQVGGPVGAPQGPPQQVPAGQQPATPAQPAPAAAPADTAEAPVVLSKDLSASVRFSAQDMKVGERLQLVVTVKNETGKPVVVAGLRGSVEDALPETLELQAPQTEQAKKADEAFTLQPGESRQVSYEAIPFDSGDITVEGPVTISVQSAGGEAQDLNIALPAQTLKVKSILTPDWKKKGFRDVAPVMKNQVPEWVWLVALPMLMVLLIGIERVLAAQKEFPRLPQRKIPLIVRSRERLAALRGQLDAPERVFYAEFDSILTTFLVDFHGLTTAQRTPEALANELKKIKTLTPGQAKVAGDLLLRAEDARFSGSPASADERRRDLANLSDLIDSIAGKQNGGAAPPKAGAETLNAAAGLQFGHPLALLLFIPLIARAVWSFINRNREKKSFTVSDGSALPRKRSLRQRLQWLPKTLRYIALSAILIGLAHPELGVRRDVVWRPSTDTMIEFDVSGSMDEQVGQNLSKLQAAGEAVKSYVDEQRRGTDNRVGLGTFSDNAYLDVRLTTDYDALIAHLKELHTLGSTAIGKSILDATAHFIELNITELGDSDDPRMAEARKILREKGLPAVLEYAQQYPDLMQKILRPDRAKVVVVFTDGDSNAGISPHDAAVLAKSLGVKVYTVFIGPDGASGIAPLQDVAAVTGAKFFRAADPNAMRDALLEVDKLEKSPSRIVSNLSLKDYSRWFILLALFALGFEVALSNTRLRAVQGMLIMTLPLGTLPGGVPDHIFNPPAIVAQAQMGGRQALPVTGVPKEVAAANLLYNEGRYDEALKAYDEALKLYPDQPELYFNMGNAYFKLGELDKAAASYGKFLGKTKDTVKSSRAVYNMSMIALAKKDAEQAKELLKESLRRDAGNEDARWNLEVLNQLQKEQQKQQQQQNQQNQKQKNKKGKGQKQKGQPQQGQPQQGQPQQGQPQQGQPQPGQPGDQQAKPQPGDKDGKQKSPAQQLGEKLGDQQKEEKDAARKAIPRKGHDSWGALALPFAAAGGTALTFSAPLWAWAAVIAAPIVAGLFAYGIHKRLEAARKLSPGTAPRDFKSWWGRGRFMRKAALVALAAALLTFGAADPKSGYKDERVNFGGKDVLVAVDGSPSTIYAEDGRFANTKKELSDFAERLQGTDRVGLIVFAGEARTASPLSVDYGNLQFKAERLERESMGLKDGSKLAEAVEYAAKSFETAKNIGDRDRILVIVSDGEIFGEDLDAAIQAAREHHITIYTIGVGSERGVKMKVPTEDGSGTEYIQDDQTHGDALTKLDEAPLRKLASSTGGAYFRAGDGGSLSKVMARVAEANKGERGQTIRSPRGVAEIFLWPALALLTLDMLLPGFSVIRREKKRPAARKRGGTKLHGAAFGLLAFSSLPLSSWPIILPFAIISTILGGLLAADLWTDGALTRRFVWSLQRRRGFVPKGALADLPRLLTTREIDQERLAQFLRSWQAAPEAARAPLIAEAAADEELAREKLLAAYLSGGEPALQERALLELGRAGRRQLKPVAPLVRLLLEKRRELPWLSHADAARAAGRLAQSFLDGSEAARARRDLGLEAPAPSWKPAPKGALKRAALGVALAVAVGSLTLAGASGWNTSRYLDEKAKAAEVTTQIFFSEDAFIFSDRYVDDRIPTLVLPALRRWSQGSEGAQDDLERAVKILAESPDPKADNILEAILRRSDLMPLNEKAERQLLTSLVLRDNDHVWRFMDELMQKSAGNQAMAKRLQTMLVIALQSGTPRAFENAFHFLKSPDENLQNFAAQAIFARLLEYGKQGQFYDRLGAVQTRYAADPELQLFVERFALMQAAGGAKMGYDSAKARTLLDKSLDIAAAWDASRGQFLAQAAAAAKQAQAQGQKAQAPDLPSLTALEIQMLGEAAGIQGVSDGVKELAKAEINRSVTELIKAAEDKIPGLHEKLIQDGVVLPDVESGYGGYGEYEGYGYGGYSSSSKHYRELYKLSHLRILQEDLAAKAGEIQTNAVDTPEFIELMDRAGKALPAMQEAGKAAGMLDGDTVAERAADPVNVVLADGVSKFSGSKFIEGLRAKGLAPDNGATSGEGLYREAYTLEQIQAVRAYLYDLAVSGNGFNYDGKPRPLTVAERKYLAGALDSLAALEARLYDAPLPKGEAVPPALTIGRISARAEKAAGKGAEERALMTELLTTLRTPAGSQATVDELNDALETLFNGATDAADRKAMLAQLSAALDGKAANAPLVVAAQTRLKDQFEKLETQLNEAFPGFNAKAAQAGVRNGEYSDYANLKLVNIRRLTGVVDAAELEAKTKGALDDKQKAALAAARALIPAMLEAGPKAGLFPGDSPGERVAEVVNPKLYDNYMKFYGTVFKTELVKHGLAPDNGQTSVDSAYAQSYSKADLQKLLAFLEDIKKSGNGWADADARRPLTDDEKTVLDAAIQTVREQLAHYPGDKTTLHGAALLGLAPLALVLGTWQIFLAVAAVGLAVWLYTRWTGDSDEGVEGPAARKTGPAPDAARRARRVELAAKKLASSVAGGSFRSLFIGAGGSDFAESRPYAGEDRRDMDWKASAKMGEPYAKKYELEKDMPLVLVVDVSGSGAFGTRGEEKRQVIEEVSSVLALAAAQLNLRVGAVFVSDKVEAYIPPKNGAQQAHEIIRRLQAQGDEPRKTDLRPALDFALKSIRSRAVVAVVSDFLAPEFRGQLAALAQRHDVRAIRVSDPAELGPMPDVGLLSVRDGETGELRDVDTSNTEFRAEHAALIERREGRLADAFSQARLRPLTLSTEGDYLQELQDAFDPKAQPTRSQK